MLPSQPAQNRPLGQYIFSVHAAFTTYDFDLDQSFAFYQ
jgi:hypothetical protein